MKLLINQNQLALREGPTEAKLIHGDETISWNIALFDKMSFDDNYDIVEQINGYWAYIPLANQDKIFDIYKRIRFEFDNVWDTSTLTKTLYGLIAELYQYHELKDIHHWKIFHTNIVIPDSIPLTFEEAQETTKTRERTYCKEDYSWLVSMSIALRAMIPIWGEFILRTKKETGTVFKEYYAFKLLAQSSVAKSEPMERLRSYVEHTIPGEKDKSSAVFDGLSTEDYPQWVLGLILVRRMTIGDIRGINPNSTLVTFIYKYIGQKVKSHDNSFIGIVKDKLVEGQGQDGENNLSRLEGYKVKQDIPDGDIVLIEHYSENHVRAVKRICPDIDLALLDKAMESVQALQYQQIWVPQMDLMRWIMKPVISPRGIINLNKLDTVRMMGVALAVLWHCEHYELAALMTAVEESNKDEMHLDTESRTRIPKDQVEIIEGLYPYPRKPVGKQKVQKRVSPAIEAIDEMARLFSEHSWRLTLPSEWMALIPSCNGNRRYGVPHNVKGLLATLTIQLATRKLSKPSI